MSKEAVSKSNGFETGALARATVWRTPCGAGMSKLRNLEGRGSEPHARGLRGGLRGVSHMGRVPPRPVLETLPASSIGQLIRSLLSRSPNGSPDTHGRLVQARAQAVPLVHGTARCPATTQPPAPGVRAPHLIVFASASHVFALLL